MEFRNAHELLEYLVVLDDTDDRWRMQTGQQLADHLRIAGKLDATRPDQEYAELGWMLWRLREDRRIAFYDFAGENRPGGRPDPHFAGFTMDDVWKFERIEVTSQGRADVNAARATVEINTNRLDVVALLGEMEREVDRLPISDDEKAQSKSKIHAAAGTLGEVAREVIVDTAAAVLRQAGHLP